MLPQGRERPGKPCFGACPSPLPRYHPHHYTALTRPVELAEEDRLPGSELRTPALDDDRQRLTHEAALDVSVGVLVRAFGAGLARHHEPEVTDHVRLHRRVAVLLDGDRSGRVR